MVKCAVMSKMDIFKMYAARLVAHLFWAVEWFTMEYESLLCDLAEPVEAIFEVTSYRGHGRTVRMVVKYSEDALAVKSLFKRLYGNADYRRIEPHE